MHQVRVSYKLVCEVPIVLSAIFFLTELLRYRLQIVSWEPHPDLLDVGSRAFDTSGPSPRETFHSRMSASL